MLQGENWRNSQEIGSQKYDCGHCGTHTGVNTGYRTEGNSARIFLCGFCNQPTYFFQNHQVPAPVYGNPVENLPDHLDRLYDEARQCTSVGAFTATVMCCRKLLMNIAVEEGAPDDLRFVEYVDYLEENHYTPPKSRDWVDAIRLLGNEANHEIDPKTQVDARTALTFAEMLLRFLYEYANIGDEQS